MMPHNPTLKDVLQRILWLARQIAWSDSAVIFLEEQGKMIAEEFRSIHRETLLGGGKLGIQESLVNRALKTLKPCLLNEEDRRGSRVFTDENVALAIPIHNYGVLYLGRRSEEDFEAQNITNLVALCQQGHFALMVARLSVSRESLQREEAESRKSAESLLHSVSNIVEMMGEIMSLREPRDVLQHTGENLWRVADFEFWAIVAGLEEGEPRYVLTGPDHRSDIDKDATRNLALLSVKSGRTLSFMNLERLSLPSPGPNINSVLLCPMIADGETIGCLLLASTRVCFSLHERELISTLALQVGSHFWNLHLHSELKLSQAQLVQSSKMAAVGQLAAGVAHELNTPLGAMNLAIEGALRTLTKKPDRAQSRLERALKSGHQLKEIVAKLLHYSTKSSSMGEETDLNQVVEDTLGLVGHQLSLDGVTIESELTADQLILVNQNEIQQVVINLLTNAKDAVSGNERNERLIWIRTWCEADMVSVSVKDNGTGMDDETRAKVFDPFFTTKDVGHGTGLGLSVTSELMEQNGGTVALETALGEGTKFTLSFPRLSY